MNFKALFLLGTSVLAALRNAGPKDTYNLTADINIAENNQLTNCNTPHEIMIMADLSGIVAASGWDNYVIPSMKMLVQSFDIGANRVGIFSRSFPPPSSFWCINVELGASSSSNMDELLAAINKMPLSYVISPGGLPTVQNYLIGGRRPNTPVVIMLLTDGKQQDKGLTPIAVSQVRSMGGIRFVCAGVGLAVDNGYLGSLCDNSIRISNYDKIPGAIEQIANTICSGSNAPTAIATRAPSALPSNVQTLAPSKKTTMVPSALPSNVQTLAPSKKTTIAPSRKTKKPTNFPTKPLPTMYPTKPMPTMYPTKKILFSHPTISPTHQTNEPTNFPTKTILPCFATQKNVVSQPRTDSTRKIKKEIYPQVLFD